MKKYEFTDWLLRVGRFNSDFASFIDAVSTKLIEIGIPINRVRISFRTLHPQVVAWTCVWDETTGAQVLEVTREVQQSEDYIGSPIEFIYKNKKPFRRSLLELTDDAHSVLFELRDSGFYRLLSRAS